MPPEISTDRVSDCFCAADADLTFRSRDGILFKVHRNNLAAHSEGFSPPPGTTSQDEFVALLENGDTLDLLFQFMSPQRQPDLAGIMFMKLAELAEAAEKYQVFSAMTVCNIYMTEEYTKHPFEVMIYAMRHGYGKLMDKAERKVLEVSLTMAFECFTPQVYIAWTRYHEQWLDLLKSFRKLCMRQIQGHNHSVDQTSHLLFFVSQLDTPASLLNWKRIFKDAASLQFHQEWFGYSEKINATLCQTCETSIYAWSDGVMEQSIRQMRKLSSFL